MNWIVLYEKSGKIVLTSKKNSNSGLLPKGSYLTVDMTLKGDLDNNNLDTEDKRKFVLRVEESEQTAIYSPSPLLADLNLGLQEADRECKNQITAHRVYDITQREDGLVDYIKPQALARLSTEEEILKATDAENNNGPFLFPATVHSSRCQKINDVYGQPVKLRIPEDVYWHQIQITGKTGSGKTVATKYLAQHFIENKITADEINRYGCVLAINVKDVDFLNMDKQTQTSNTEAKREWDSLNFEPKGIQNYEILYSAHENLNNVISQGVSGDLCTPITLNASKIDPESLLGIVENLTELATQALPDVFRYWQRNHPNGRFAQFLDFLEDCREQDYNFNTRDVAERDGTTRLNPATANAMISRLKNANRYFENEKGNEIDADSILQEGKMTVIDVARSIEFGSIVLRYLLNRIVVEKTENNNDIPVLIIIDEVHQFYKSSASRNALGDLDTICRIGRSKKIGVVFSSQNINDIPNGLTSVINTKFMFKTDEVNKKTNGINPDDILSMKAGYCVTNIHGLPQLKLAKFPLSKSGVI
ncbi:ATP-binding protein [Winogradskyella psychrotolerans]|uniref:ATP-binding protein n=1 Tax=Winogradskyella psychrotolerans TaxID=1344585 RepID=UPI001C06B7D2|nr:ATP-binding protein [Winogradskyella psychrotolerans]MBU2922494.1 ATP-binding protein [Winogradskyella psychrotolerans]